MKIAKISLAVVGPSGSGKSSAVMAGLLPRLQAGGLPGSQRWLYLDPMIPGVHPLEALALTFARHLPDRSLTTVRDDLNDESARGLHLLANCLSKLPEMRVVLFIDQFEEVFTQTISEEERQHFLDQLITAVSEPQGPTILILTLRADFYDRPMHYPELFQLIEEHHSFVLPMDLKQLREVIEKPAGLPDVRLTFEGDLESDLLFEVHEQIGALPLLQYRQHTISEDAAEWERHGKPRDRLYRGSQLKDAKMWASRNIPSTYESAFLRTSTVRQKRSRVSVAVVCLLDI